MRDRDQRVRAGGVVWEGDSRGHLRTRLKADGNPASDKRLPCPDRRVARADRGASQHVEPIVAACRQQEDRAPGRVSEEPRRGEGGDHAYADAYRTW